MNAPWWKPVRKIVDDPQAWEFTAAIAAAATLVVWVQSAGLTWAQAVGLFGGVFLCFGALLILISLPDRRS